MVSVARSSSEVGSYTNTKKKKRGERLKYICYYEFKPEDLDKVIPLFQKMRELRETED